MEILGALETSLLRLRLTPVAAAAVAVAATAGPLQAQGAGVRVELTGVSGDPAQNIRAVLALAQAEAEDQKLPSARIRQLFREGDQQIRIALQPYGYYQPVIHGRLEPGSDTWVAHYLVHPGPPTLVRTVDLEVTGDGADQPGIREAAELIRRQQGDTLNHLRYEDSKLALLAAATDSGFLRADFDSTAIEVDRSADTARIVMRFHTGPLMHFGAVSFRQDILDSAFLASRIPFKQGEVFRQKKLRQLQDALTADPYFEAVEVIPHPEQARDTRVPIEVVLTPRPPQAYEVGVGYGTDNGPRGRMTARFRRLNRKGHNAEVDLIASTLQQSVSSRYVIPGVLHPTGALTLLAGYALLNPTVSSSHTFLVGGRLTRKRFGWNEDLSLIYQRESFNIGADTGVATMLIGSIGYDRSRSNNVVFPTRGFQIHGEIKASRKGLLSDRSFLEISAGGKLIRGLLPRVRLLTRADAGRVFSGDFRSLPPSVRFFTGGDETIRGYRFETIGPYDAAGEPIGGKILLAGSVELDYRVLDRWAIAGFSDAGNSLASITPFILRYSIGGGIRWISPVGLIRLDLAYTLNRPDALPGGPFLLHFRMGPDL